MRILVDADACPVKAEIRMVAERRNLPVILVSNSGLRPSRDPMVRHVVVSGSFDAADDWIVENALPGDIAVTADVPLAVRLIDRGVIAISPKGRIHDERSIAMTSAMRNLAQDLREAGAINSHNPPFTQRDRSAFIEGLEQAIRRSRSLPPQNG